LTIPLIFPCHDTGNREEKMVTEDRILDVDVYWSMRSPYCYIALDRCLEMPKRYNVNLNLKVVYPDAIKGIKR